MIFDKPFDFDRFVRLLLGVFVVVGIYFLLDTLSAVLIPFFAAWLTAYLLEPTVEKAQRLLHRRVPSVLLTLPALFLTFVFAMIIFIPAIAEEIESLKELLTTQLSNMAWPAWIPQDIAIQLNGHLSNVQWQDVIAQEAFMDKAATALTGVWDLMSSVVGVVGALFGIVTYVLYLVFLMLDYDRMSKDWKTLLPEKLKGFVVQLADDMEEGMNGYFRAQTKIVVCVAILFAVGFKIIGLPFAISLGIVLGIMNYIPYSQLLGIIPAVGLAALHALETHESFWMMLLFVLLVFTVVQLVQDILLTPYFMGEFSGFNPAVILLSLSIWGSLLGVVGIIIAIPLTSIVLAYYKRYILKH